jgi:hypothetical protein
MNWLRNRLRRWLGVTSCEARVVMLQNTCDGLVSMAKELAKKHTEANDILREAKELKEMVADPKRSVVVTKNARQFRSLMEVE